MQFFLRTYKNTNLAKYSMNKNILDIFRFIKVIILGYENTILNLYKVGKIQK